MCDILPDVGGVKEGFGRDAADMEAAASQLVVFLDDGGLEPVLAGSHRSGVASRATADNNKIVGHFFHFTCIRWRDCRFGCEGPSPQNVRITGAPEIASGSPGPRPVPSALLPRWSGRVATAAVPCCRCRRG